MSSLEEVESTVEDFTEARKNELMERLQWIMFENPEDQKYYDLLCSGRYEVRNVDCRWMTAVLSRTVDGKCAKFVKTPD